MYKQQQDACTTRRSDYIRTPLASSLIVKAHEFCSRGIPGYVMHGDRVPVHALLAVDRSRDCASWDLSFDLRFCHESSQIYGGDLSLNIVNAIHGV